MSKQANRGRRGAVRQKAVKAADLANMERHGKREDESGQRRRVREAAPLVYGSLDIRDACAAHLDGVQRSRGTKTECLHVLVQFPTKLIDGADEDQQRRMLNHAVRFVNEYHGGDAVFAARLDRDEKGQHSVDVFAMPRYDFRYKDGRTVKKASVSKFSKEHARERFHKLDKAGKPILDKKGQKIPRDDRRAQGSALQDAWFEYMRDQMGLAVEAPERKAATTADRVEPEVYGLRQDQVQLEEARRQFGEAGDRLMDDLDRMEDDLAAERAAWESEKDRQKRQMREERQALAAERREAQHLAGTAQQFLKQKGRIEEAARLAQRSEALTAAPARKKRGRDGPALDE